MLGHPSNGGELIPRQAEGQVPLCGGVARSAGVVYSIAQATVTKWPVARAGVLIHMGNGRRPIQMGLFAEL